MHELGHNLGLDHTEIKDLMYFRVSRDTSLSNKKRGDIITNQISPDVTGGSYEESSKYKTSSSQEAANFIKKEEIR